MAKLDFKRRPEQQLSVVRDQGFMRLRKKMTKPALWALSISARRSAQY
jgi:hypothetical protein